MSKRSGLIVWIFFGVWLTQMAACPTQVSGKSDPFSGDADHDTNRISRLLQRGRACLEKPYKTDSALAYFSQASEMARAINRPEWQAQCKLAFARLYSQRHDILKSRLLAREAIGLLLPFGPTLRLGDAYAEMADFYDTYQDTELVAKIRCWEMAANIYNRCGKYNKYANAMYQAGFFHTVKGDSNNSKIIDTLQKAAEIDKRAHSAILPYVYNTIGSQYHKYGNYKEALMYYLLALKTAADLNDTTLQVSNIYMDVGLYFYNLNRYRASFPYLQKALAILVEYNDTEGILTTSQGLISAYYKAGELKKAVSLLENTEKKYRVNNPDDWMPLAGIALICYTRLNEPDLAGTYLQKLLRFSKQHPILDRAQAYVYDYLIIYYLHTGQYKKVYKYCQYNEMFSNQYALPRIKASNYHWWYEADSALGNYKAALEHYQKGIKIKDSIFTEENKRQIEEMQISYESEKKEKDIKLLTQQSQLQETRLQKAQLTKNIMLGGALALVLLLGLSYNRYRLKQRSNVRLEAQQLEINRKNESLNRLLNEKEWLIKEIHHRVKNNLQIVMSLLNTQSLYLDNDAAVAAIHESRHRIQAMSIIHQKLYQADNTALVEMKSYIADLVSYLRESEDAGRLYFSEEVEPIEMDVAQAIPVGLILNEAITNAIKYAFPEGVSGTITIAMHKLEDNLARLSISDNGIGLPPDYNTDKAGTLGISLMKGLSHQLEGTFELKNEDGLKIEIVFPYLDLIRQRED